tara:strand:+ start:9369 stop:9578 length:210 start_codon:yes stop_codon:yes gene_type:complete
MMHKYKIVVDDRDVEILRKYRIETEKQQPDELNDIILDILNQIESKYDKRLHKERVLRLMAEQRGMTYE